MAFEPLSPPPPQTQVSSTQRGGPAQADRIEPPSDVRAGRPYALLAAPLRTLGRRLLSIATLAALDIAGLALGIYAALVLRELVYGNTEILWSLLWEGPSRWLPFLAPVTVLVFWQAGLYAARERRAGPGTVVSSLVLIALVVLAFGIGTDYQFTTSGLIPVATALSALTIGLFRAAYGSATAELLRVSGVRRRVILVGHGEALAALHRTLGSGRGDIDYEFVGAIAHAGEPGLRVLGELDELDELEAILARERADELILAEEDLGEERVLAIVEAAHSRGVRVRLAPKTTELLVQRGEYVPGQGAPLFELRPPVLAGADWIVKRTFDTVVSLLVVTVGLPLWLLVAAAIKLDSRGPVLYLDRRVGVGEHEFPMFKFRTMVQGADRPQARLEAQNEAGGALFKIRDDPRVTRVGAVLRRLSLDELPQVLNVLRGEMSLVGPRPLPLRDYDKLAGWHRKRYLVLPGITGLWQISGRSNLSFDDLVRLDFYYLENWSIWLDISILVKTIPAVLGARGAY
ncbi:MAG: sugar transferase [Actinobacteria bacterium]|nr:sugar transferase [Actinomycetota bacterium]